MTSLEELQSELLQVYTQQGKGINDFVDDLASLTQHGISREEALIKLALQHSIEIDEIVEMKKRGLSEEKIIRNLSHDLKKAQKLNDILREYPRKTVAHPTPNALYYLLPLAMGIVGGFAAYVYVKDVDPEMAKDLVAVGLIVSFIYSALVFYLLYL